MKFPIQNICKVKLVLFIVLLPVIVQAQAFNGYTLFSPLNSRNTYLVDMTNTVRHSWTHSRTGGYSCYLLPDGTLMRSAISSNSTINGGGATGIVQKIAWNGSLLWEYTYSSSTYRTHHDIEILPNGNVLLIAWEVKTAAQCIAAGLNHSATLWPDHIIEVQPVGTNGGNIVWKWHAWDHLIQDYDPTKNNYGVVADHPELLDINVGSTSGDWMHINGISYNETLDQIIISSHNLDEVYVIDHSTTTLEAAGHTGGNSGRGGDFLYRWGRPANYRAPGAQVFNVVHCSVWIPEGLPGAGHIMAFNNREGQGTSMIVELVPPSDSLGHYSWTPGTAYAPGSPFWSYTAAGFYSNHLGGCQRLPNGNTIISESTSGYLFEVDAAGNTVWSYNRGGEIPRVLRYAPDYPGLAALPVELTSFTAIENNGVVDLHWTTSTETNNLGFEVQRGRDKNQFLVIGYVDGNGTSTQSKNYSFSDNAVSFGAYYYRLKQIDTDGTFTYSDVVEVNVPDPAEFILSQNYPNPFNPETVIEFTIPVLNADTEAAILVQLKVYDVLGKEIATLVNEYKTAGTYQSSINSRAYSLTSGIYFYRLSAGEFVQTKRMILVK